MAIAADVMTFLLNKKKKKKKNLPCKDFCFIFAIVSGIFGLTISEIILSLKFKGV
jgi:hypothetical protein